MTTTQIILCGYALFIVALLIMVIAIIKDQKLSKKVLQSQKNDEEAELKLQIREKEEEIKRIQSEKETEKKDGEADGPRFPMLFAIDREMSGVRHDTYNNSLNLAGICDVFRNFSANRLKLYYSISDIRSFISGMATSHLILMQGMSGTGKTSLAYAFGQFIENNAVMVPVQPMWKESSDLMGYYNEFTNRFNETNMLCALYRAGYTRDIYIAVLDEMNIARVEYYFAEFLSMLEIPNPDERKIRILSDAKKDDPSKLVNGEVLVPENVWFIGTANNDDSTFAISDKVYDRAMVLNLDKRAEPFYAERTGSFRFSCDHFEKLVAEAVSKYALTDRNKRRIKQLDAYLKKNLHISFGNRIMKQLEKYVAVYIACGGREMDAIDDLMSKKVIRKLESQNPVFVKNALPELFDFMSELFDDDGLPKCREYMKKIEMSV